MGRVLQAPQVRTEQVLVRAYVPGEVLSGEEMSRLARATAGGDGVAAEGHGRAENELVSCRNGSATGPTRSSRRAGCIRSSCLWLQVMSRAGTGSDPRRRSTRRAGRTRRSPRPRRAVRRTCRRFHVRAGSSRGGRREASAPNSARARGTPRQRCPAPRTGWLPRSGPRPTGRTPQLSCRCLSAPAVPAGARYRFVLGTRIPDGTRGSKSRLMLGSPVMDSAPHIDVPW